MLATSASNPGIVIVVLIAYFFPTIVAAFRKTHNSGGVFVMNLLLGWTIIGWWIAFGMASGSRMRTPERVCPACGHEPKRGQTACRCGYDFAAAAAVNAGNPQP